MHHRFVRVASRHGTSLRALEERRDNLPGSKVERRATLTRVATIVRQPTTDRPRFSEVVVNVVVVTRLAMRGR
ncbi:hypothetical protein BMF35_a0538 [Aurantiacibacter gangjinensis]|nr:hypothetical protein BMF35_a0538 [Aurantiacibacter gangjinensis]